MRIEASTLLASLILSIPCVAPAAILDNVKLQPETERAFDRYTASVEATQKADPLTERFFWMRDPAEQSKVRGGNIRTVRQTLGAGQAIDVPGGQIHDLSGAMFLPGHTIAQVKAVRQDYANYKKLYAPEVVSSWARPGAGEDAEVILRLRQKHVITVLLNACFHTGYESLNPHTMNIYSRSVQITEANLPDPCTQAAANGDDRGFLWKLNSYWRLFEADGGVYVECRAVSLSRDIPGGLHWAHRLLDGFINSFPQESLSNLLSATRRAVNGAG